MSTHAKLFSPSSIASLFLCPGRPKMEEGLPDEGGEDARKGTARHLVCGVCLVEGKDVVDFIGREIVFWRHPESDSEGECFRDELGENPECELLHSIDYDEEWVDEDQDYVDVIRTAAAGATIEVEQRVNFSMFTGHDDPEDSFGHLDASFLRPLDDSQATFELVVADRKTGRVPVRVEGNKQLMTYALGRYQELSLMYEITRVRLIVHQREAQEWDCSIEELLAFGEKEVPAMAARVLEAQATTRTIHFKEWEQKFLNPEPTVEACAYCRAMATCPSMQRAVQRAVEMDFPTIVQIADPSEFPTVDIETAFKAAPLVEAWADAVKTELKRRLMAREPSAAWKLVQGRQGNRKWKDATAVEKYLKDTARVKSDVMYTKKLISPTVAEKLVKAKELRPGQWDKLTEHITRGEPSIAIAPITDKRDAYLPPDPTADFPTLPEETPATN